VHEAYLDQPFIITQHWLFHWGYKGSGWSLKTNLQLVTIKPIEVVVWYKNGVTSFNTEGDLYKVGLYFINLFLLLLLCILKILMRFFHEHTGEGSTFGTHLKCYRTRHITKERRFHQSVVLSTISNLNRFDKNGITSFNTEGDLYKVGLYFINLFLLLLLCILKILMRFFHVERFRQISRNSYV
jgi:predicted CDP-diglyceride synthetase/phosphatidate cytidylyltransferase